MNVSTGQVISQRIRKNDSVTFMNKTAHPWKWKYDAGAEHARYLQRHPEKASVTQAA